ncbi:hypothetical protein B0H13DRAFT_1909921 [Mycena leptocephala]|nr:hypothetical protein B0H13DRAFT_1909921 [Mycena leptocephala]
MNADSCVDSSRLTGDFKDKFDTDRVYSTYGWVHLGTQISHTYSELLVAMPGHSHRFCTIKRSGKCIVDPATKGCKESGLDLLIRCQLDEGGVARTSKNREGELNGREFNKGSDEGKFVVCRGGGWRNESKGGRCECPESPSDGTAANGTAWLSLAAGGRARGGRSWKPEIRAFWPYLWFELFRMKCGIVMRFE